MEPLERNIKSKAKAKSQTEVPAFALLIVTTLFDEKNPSIFNVSCLSNRKLPRWILALYSRLMKWSDKELVKGVEEGNFRAIARLISLVENGSARAPNILPEIFKNTGNAHIVGVTGSPGAGKSTLVDELAYRFRTSGKKVGIIAVDPTSPFSGGAILGDRVRMNRACEFQDIFIRSMATRGALGGLSRTALEAVQILDSAGFDVILVETVGVGQIEVDIVRLADSCVVVLVPGMGDAVQAFKAGILEIADFFVINKADRDGADLLQKDLRVLMSLGEYGKTSWTPKIIRTIATKAEGIEELQESILEHHVWLESSPEGRKRKLRILEDKIVSLVMSALGEKVLKEKQEKLKELTLACFEKRSDPYSAAKELTQ